MHNWVILD